MEKEVFTKEEIEKRIRELEKEIEELKRKYPREYEQIKEDVKYAKEYLKNLIGKEKNLVGIIKGMEELIEKHKFTFNDFPTISTVGKMTFGELGSVISALIGKKLLRAKLREMV